MSFTALVNPVSKAKWLKHPLLDKGIEFQNSWVLVHTDVCGPMSTMYHRMEYSYFVTFTDDHSRYQIRVSDKTQT